MKTESPDEQGKPVADIDGWRICNFCGCRTNAKLRRCCTKGYKADLASPPQDAQVAAHWKRMYECAQNANAYRQQALDSGCHETTEQLAAMVLARRVLLDWQSRYAEWSNDSGKQMARAMDYKLPPAEHIRTLEDLDAAIDAAMQENQK